MPKPVMPELVCQRESLPRYRLIPVQEDERLPFANEVRAGNTFTEAEDRDGDAFGFLDHP
jgi:hypothetical protein